MSGPPVVDAAEAGVEGARLLDEVEAFVRRFVAFPSIAAVVAFVLWLAHAHAVKAFESSPRLALLSPEPGSGKTRGLEVAELLVPEARHVLSASVAAIFRTIDSEHPTLLFDEVDSIFGKRTGDDHEDLRALLNAGHRKGATIPRCVGPTHTVVSFPVYAAVALAGLGDLPDTLMTRSVIIRMRRRAPGETITPFRYRLHAPEGHGLRERLAAWTGSVAAALTDAWPTMPPGVEDRPADVWEPLLAVADAAGGEWPARARSACSELVRVAASGEASLGVRLLADLRAVFADADAVPTDTLLERLRKLDEAPWGELRGKPLDPRGLARLLRRYEVAPVSVKAPDGRVLRGYRREHLWDAWTRYLPATDPPADSPDEESATAATSATAQATALFPVADADPGSATDPLSATAEPPPGQHRSAGSGSSGQAGVDRGEGCPACSGTGLVHMGCPA